MSLKRKAAIGLAALVVCFFMVMVASRERYDGRLRRAMFAGFTNTGPGQVNAIIRFPSVHPRGPKSTFFYKPFYEIDLKVLYIDSAGRGRTRRFSDRIAVSATLPLGEADMPVPVLPDTVSLRLLNAEGRLGFYGDNELFGWRPPEPKGRRWEFQMGAISIGSTNSAAAGLNISTP